MVWKFLFYTILTQEVLAEQLGRLGGTPFHLGRLELQTDQPVFVPTSQNYLNTELR